MKNSDLIHNLDKTDMSIKEQEKEFMSKTKRSRRTFYRYRKSLGLRAVSKKFDYNKIDKGVCYFCSKKATIIHHIDENTSNNCDTNLIPLCRSCHNKIHRVLANLKKSHCRNKLTYDTATKQELFTCEKCGKETDEVTLDCICLDCDNIYSDERGCKNNGK